MRGFRIAGFPVPLSFLLGFTGNGALMQISCNLNLFYLLIIGFFGSLNSFLRTFCAQPFSFESNEEAQKADIRMNLSYNILIYNTLIIGVSTSIEIPKVIS